MSATVDVLIIGGGVAGSSAALTLARQRHTVIVFDTSKYRFDDSYHLHGLVGQEHVTPKELIAKAHKELEQFKDVTLQHTEITKLRKEGSDFVATAKDGETYRGKKVILAHGVLSQLPDIDGYAACWGKGIFHNLFAQAYNADPEHDHAGVLAEGPIGMAKWTAHMSHLSNQLVKSITIYTNGSESLLDMTFSNGKPEFTPVPVSEFKEGIAGKPWKVDTRKITKLARKTPDVHESTAVNITFEDGETITEAFISHAPFTALNNAFAKELDIKTNNFGDYDLNGFFQETSVKGIYAVGDTMTLFKVLPNAVASGAQAAAGVAVALQEEKHGLAPVWG